MGCLYKSSKHSPKIGDAGAGRPALYGKWEDFSSSTLPQLDVCGGHFGITPDSNGQVVYHNHVQDKPPFTYGCYGPNAQGGLVTVQQCRGLYTGGRRRLQPNGGKGGTAGGGGPSTGAECGGPVVTLVTTSKKIA